MLADFSSSFRYCDWNMTGLMKQTRSAVRSSRSGSAWSKCALPKLPSPIPWRASIPSSSLAPVHHVASSSKSIGQPLQGTQSRAAMSMRARGTQPPPHSRELPPSARSRQSAGSKATGPTESPSLSAWMSRSLSCPPLSSTQTLKRLPANMLAITRPAGPAPMMQMSHR